MPFDWHCDGTEDCTDSSDEEGCSGRWNNLCLLNFLDSFKTHLIYIHKYISIKWIIGSTYVVLEKNNVCSKNTTLQKKIECMEAATIWTDKDYGGEVLDDSDGTFPKGCYGNGQHVYFNTHPVGNRESQSAPICKNGKFLLLQIKVYL